jgi:hypothetical protein
MASPDRIPDSEEQGAWQARTAADVAALDSELEALMLAVAPSKRRLPRLRGGHSARPSGSPTRSTGSRTSLRRKRRAGRSRLGELRRHAGDCAC